MKTLAELIGLPSGFLIIQENPRFHISPFPNISPPGNDNTDIEVSQ